MENEKLEAICFNCNQFFPANMDEPTELGICLNDQAFEPFIDELFENHKTAPCQQLVDDKKFSGEQEACDAFDEIEEGMDIDENSPLGMALSRLSETGELDIESFRAAIIEEKINNIDWKKLPVDQYVTPLRSSNPRERDTAINALGGLIAFGNMEAYHELFHFFKQLPPLTTTKAVHLKIELFRHLNQYSKKSMLLPELIEELYETPSNNTTRQWISKIFHFLEQCPRKEIREPLEKMLKDKRFSYRLKQKMKNLLDK
jgi:hypothetical protein